MNEYQAMIAAMQIFLKYYEDDETGPWFGSEHDEIFAGPDPSDVSDEDIAALNELGWSKGDGSFYYFT